MAKTTVRSHIMGAQLPLRIDICHKCSAARLMAEEGQAAWHRRSQPNMLEQRCCVAWNQMACPAMPSCILQPYKLCTALACHGGSRAFGEAQAAGTRLCSWHSAHLQAVSICAACRCCWDLEAVVARRGCPENMSHMQTPPTYSV